LQLAFTLSFRIRFWGAANVPRRGGVVLASNHQSFLDPMAVGVGLPRQCHYLARRSLFEQPLFGRFLRALHVIPLERGAADRVAIRHAVTALDHGCPLVLFPEGTRSRDGRVGAFQPGFAIVAARAGAPIVPVAVDGAFEAWPRGRRLPVPGRVRVAYGEPMEASRAGKAQYAATADEVRQRVLALQECLKQSK